MAILSGGPADGKRVYAMGDNWRQACPGGRIARYEHKGLYVQHMRTGVRLGMVLEFVGYEGEEENE